jgi:NADH-quinone oxidoreductase subunit L
LTGDLQLWLLPALPLAGFLINGLFGRRLPKAGVSFVAVSSVTLALLWALRVFAAASGLTTPHIENYFTWIESGELQVPCSFYLDRLSLLMLLVVTGVGTIIHFYSIGYMADDPGYYRFFAYLNLFMFFMLVLVLAANYVLLFVGWEGVGLASYLLIGFWFRRRSAADAGKKAFLVNRVGDFGYSLGIFLLFLTFRSFDFAAVFPKAAGADTGTLTWIGLLLFVGAAGKSAQVPLYVWLPDAMEGPTPVSALIHAATMVTAGVYMVARSAPIFTQAPAAMDVVAVIGAVTAFFAATIGLVQSDIKRVLAYSTISQLGYMFLGAGTGGFDAGIFHLMTHAFFKALLFLAAGSVIHAVSGEQDMRRMGGLARRIPVTCTTFIAGALAIAGIPPLAGFFSKDLILLRAFERSPVLYVIGLVTAFLTAFYVFRAVFLTFFGAPRLTPEAEHHLHESPPIMTVPLVLLAILSVVGGWIPVPRWLGIGPAVEVAHGTELTLMIVAVVAAAAGIALAYYLYLARPETSERLAASAGALYDLVRNKYYVDEIYGAAIVRPVLAISTHFLWKVMDAGVIDGTVNMVGRRSIATGGVLRRMQSGNLRSYAGWVTLGAAALIAIVLWKI